MLVRRRRSVLFVAGVLLAMILVACSPASTGGGEPSGGGEETTGGSGEAAGGEEATSAPEPTASSGGEETTGGAEMALPDQPLTVLEWSGYEATAYPEFAVPFSDTYADNLDQVLEYSFFAEDAEAYAKLQSGFEADVFHPCNSWWQLYVDSGLAQPIDTSRLSNWGGVNADLAAMGQFNGQQYFVPWDWGYESILVRNDLVPEPPTSWADLWNPDYAGHVVLWDSGEANFVMTALSLGLDPYNTTPEENDQIKQKLIDLKPNLLTYWVDYTETYEMPTTGDTWLMANVWQDAYANLVNDYDVSYIQPAEKRLGWACGYGLSSNLTDTARLDLAYQFLDSTISPDSMAALGNEYWYGFSNLDAMPLVDDFVVQFMELDQIDTLTDRTFFYQPLTEEQRQAITQLWDEVKAAP